MKRRKRNTPAFTFLAWASFAIAMLAEYIGIYYLQEPLSVKGYYAVTGVLLVMSSFVLQKAIRDNKEDEDDEKEAQTRPEIILAKDITKDVTQKQNHAHQEQ